MVLSREPYFFELDDLTIEVLQICQKSQFANQDTDFIISRFGDPFCKSTICRIIKRKAQQVGVPVITGKGLRHSHASYLINVLKKGILYVARRMGHADKSTTLNTYSHWFNALDKTVSEEITQNIKSAGLWPRTGTRYSVYRLGSFTRSGGGRAQQPKLDTMLTYQSKRVATKPLLPKLKL